MRKVRFVLAVLMSWALCIPALAIDETENPRGRSLRPIGAVRSVYKSQGHNLSFTGLTSQGGPMAVAIEYSSPAGASKRIVVSTHRFGDYQAALGTFFSDVDAEFLASARLAQSQTIAELTRTPFDGSPRLRAKARLALVEIGSLASAANTSKALSLEDTPGCEAIGRWAFGLSACAITGVGGPLGVVPCLVAISQTFNISLDMAQGCINTILQFICESNGPNYHFFAADPNVPGSHWDCYECNASCVVVASSEDSGGGELADRGGPENQIADSGFGSSGGFDFYWSGTPSGGVGVCSTIFLPDGRVVVHCD